MKFVKQLFNFYLNSSIHVSLSVFSLTWITLLELDLAYNEPVLYFIFYASITGYNFVKYFGIAKFHHRQLAGWLKVIQILSFICFCLMCFYLFQLRFLTLTYVFVFGVLTFLYAIPFLLKKDMSLRTIGGLKVFVIALIWTGVTVIIPVVNESVSFTSDIALMGFQRFLFILVLMIPFEIRDLKFDSENLQTIPQRIGISRTKYLGIILLGAFFLLEFLKDETNSNQILILLIVCFLTAILILLSKVNQGRYYSAFWVEALPLIWLMLVIFIS